MSETVFENVRNTIRGGLLGTFFKVAGSLTMLSGTAAASFDIHAAEAESLYQTKMLSGEPINPKRGVGTSVAWVVGENEPLFASADDNQKIVDPINQQFYTSSLVKPLVYVAVMRKMESDAIALAAGKIKAEDALDYDSVLIISNRAKNLSNHRSFENEVTVEEALPLLLSFSMNDVAHAFAERVANGQTISRDISESDSKELEKKFVLEHMRPIAKELGMSNTFLVNATGLPTYSNRRKTIPTWCNNVSTPHDMMMMFNYIPEKYPQYLELSSQAEVKMPNRSRVFKNSNPLLENSTKNESDRVQAIPFEGVDSGKTGLSALSLWNVVLYYEGEEGRLGVLSTGNDNDEYAQIPKAALEKGLDALQQRSLHADLFRTLEYCPIYEND